MPLDVGKCSDVEIAHCDTREPLGCPPVFIQPQFPYDFVSVHVVVAAYEGVEQEQLADSVRQIQHLNHKVKNRQKISVFSSADHAYISRHKIPAVGQAPPAVLLGTAKITMHVLGHEADGFVSRLQERSQRQSLGCFHEVVQIQTGSIIEEAPYHARQIKKHCLSQKNHGNPLVISYAQLRFVFFRDMLFGYRHVVGVGHPAELIGEVLVVIRELGGTPTVDRLAHILLGADDDSENYQNKRGVTMV